MKKTVLIAVAMFSTFMFANAQYRPDKMDVTTEVYYSPGGATDGAFELPTYGMNVRLFLSEKWAVKLNLGVALPLTPISPIIRMQTMPSSRGANAQACSTWW